VVAAGEGRALVFVLALSRSFAINLQLLGGVWILQTFPAIVVGLYARWFHRWALLAGWTAGMVDGTWAAYGVASPAQAHVGGPLVAFPGTDTKVHIAASAFLVNPPVTGVLTVLFRAVRVDPGVEETRAGAGGRPASRLPTPDLCNRPFGHLVSPSAAACRARTVGYTHAPTPATGPISLVLYLGAG
jgi:Na+/proline symporter